MKKLIFALIVTTSFLGSSIFMSCQSAQKEEVKAQEKVQEAKQDLNEAQQKANEAAAKAAKDEEVRMYKADVQARIDQNNAKIADLRVKLKKPGKALDKMYATRIDDLEQKNKELKSRIDAYDVTKSDWESFKREFNHDMDELGNALADFTKDNKK